MLFASWPFMSLSFGMIDECLCWRDRCSRWHNLCCEFRLILIVRMVSIIVVGRELKAFGLVTSFAAGGSSCDQSMVDVQQCMSASMLLADCSWCELFVNTVQFLSTCFNISNCRHGSIALICCVGLRFAAILSPSKPSSVFARYVFTSSDC